MVDIQQVPALVVIREKYISIFSRGFMFAKSASKHARRTQGRREAGVKTFLIA
jgi:hypothetical protein